MGAFRRVDGEQAGPAALGILVPPGKRTFVILRPRALSFDLLLVRQPGGDFQNLAHDEASAAAMALHRGLRDGLTGPSVGVEVVPSAGGFAVQAAVGPLALLACARTPGRPYQPMVCPEEDARLHAAALLAVLRPGEGVEQEVYFNARFFSP